MNKTWLVVVLAGSMLGSTAFGDDKKMAAPAPGKAAPAGPPKASPELQAATKYFIGHWQCNGNMPAGPWGPGGKDMTSLSFKMDMNDMWMNVEGDMKMADAKAPMKMEFKALNGYDPMSKQLVRTDWDSMGNVMHLTSAGWEGDKLVFSGDGMQMGQKMKMRHTMTKKSETEMTSSMETAGADGKWMTMGESVCKKAAKGK
jgi:hypothetical protein